MSKCALCEVAVKMKCALLFHFGCFCGWFLLGEVLSLCSVDVTTTVGYCIEHDCTTSEHDCTTSEHDCKTK